MCVGVSVPALAPVAMGHMTVLLLCTFLDVLAANKVLGGVRPTNHSWPLPTLLAHVKKLIAPQNATAADICYGYFDVMGHYDNTFNCSTGTYRFCCGTCYYRFCCEDRHERLDQKSCRNYVTPIWVDQPQASTTIANGKVQEYNPLKDQTNSTVYVICGVISFTLAVGIGAKIAFNRASNQPEAREINVPRALVDILRHQTVTVNRSERNNSTSISPGPPDNGPARPPKNLYNPIKPLKSNHDNMHHNYIHLTLNSPKHSATLDYHMNNQAHFPGSSMKYNTLSFSRSFHNLSHLPPSYESAMKSDISKYCSLKRLEKDTDDFYMKRKHLAELTRGTLPLHAMKMTYDRGGYPEKSQTPRRVMSQEHILTEYNNPYLDNQPPVRYDYTILREQRPMSHERLLSREVIHSQEHLLSPERLQQHSPTPFHDVRLGHQKALSHSNVCSGSTTMLDCQHTLKMNSHTTAASSPKATWDAGNSGTTSRRQAFAAKRQNTVEQLQFIPGHLPSHNQQHLRTGSKNEVTV
uniref:Protein shisa-7 n=1 Tax=Geotrypetes seraphini TaxID=260995 RepID=A0A6P8STF0_GEOSA|nr:protein shisa-7 [Geotrypetes seraphini]